MMMWGIFVPWMNETASEWRKIYNNVLNDLYPSLKIFRLKISRRIKWAVHAACTGDWRALYRILVDYPREIFHLGDTSVEGTMLLR
jgi:hypothetical protein